MRKIYCISYDLNKSGKDYKGLIEELEKSYAWWHYLKSTWLVHTSENAQQIWDRLSKHCDNDDFILIIETGRDYSGWLPQKAWDWIRERI